MKLHRTYLLTIGIGPYGPPTKTGGGLFIAETTGTVIVAPPITLEFDVRREFAAAAQTATLKIKNLAPKTRGAIYKDQYATAIYAPVTLQAGYENQFMPTIFQGTIREAQSHREGRVDMVTQIEAFDGGFATANSHSSMVLAPGTPVSDAIGALNGDLVKTSSTPIIGTVPQKLGSRATVLVGPTFALIQKLLPPNVTATIDNNQLKVLADTDALTFGEQTFLVSSATGLLDPPVREGQGIACRMLFEPRISLGQQVQLVSEDNPKFNGTYQVKGVSHQGIISAAEGGAAFTTLLLYNFGILNALTGSVLSSDPSDQ